MKVPSEEEKLFAKMGITGALPNWKGHPIEWCDMCECFILCCERCKNSTCNGGGCDECNGLFAEWQECKTSPWYYLTEEERKTYYKVMRLIKDFIPASLSMGKKEIDWKALEASGMYSNKDWEIFEFEKKGLTNSWK
jgi:hypothetical protein